MKRYIFIVHGPNKGCSVFRRYNITLHISVMCFRMKCKRPDKVLLQYMHSAMYLLCLAKKMRPNRTQKFPLVYSLSLTSFNLTPSCEASLRLSLIFVSIVFKEWRSQKISFTEPEHNMWCHFNFQPMNYSINKYWCMRWALHSYYNNHMYHWHYYWVKYAEL